MNKQIIRDPQILKADAVKALGNQSRLAEMLGLARSTVCEWKVYVPPYHAYRLLQIYPELKSND